MMRGGSFEVWAHIDRDKRVEFMESTNDLTDWGLRAELEIFLSQEIQSNQSGTGIAFDSPAGLP